MPLAWRTRSHDNGLLGALETVDHFLESGDPLLASLGGHRRCPSEESPHHHAGLHTARTHHARAADAGRGLLPRRFFTSFVSGGGVVKPGVTTCWSNNPG